MQKGMLCIKAGSCCLPACPQVDAVSAEELLELLLLLAEERVAATHATSGSAGPAALQHSSSMPVGRPGSSHGGGVKRSASLQHGEQGLPGATHMPQAAALACPPCP